MSWSEDTVRAGDLQARKETKPLVEAEPVQVAESDFAQSVAEGLSAESKWLHCSYLYDAEGSRLFEEITKQPEYYPTRTEAAILERYATQIAELTGPRTLVELGSGYSVKTEFLLSAYSTEKSQVRYVPIDVSSDALRAARESIAKNFPKVNTSPICGTYGDALPMLGGLSPQLVVFLGSTLGNFNDDECESFLSGLASHTPVGDYLLLGVDLVKDPEILEAAYNDAAGVTARFTKNYFARMNRELGTDLDLDHIHHEASWNSEREQIEIMARFSRAQNIDLTGLDRGFEVAADETILMELSRKFRLEKLEQELAKFGFALEKEFTDDQQWFGLLLLRRR